MAVNTLDDCDVEGRRVLMRVDFNVPMSDGVISSDARIRAAVPGVRRLRDAGARLQLMSHFGRPREGRPEARYSLRLVAARLAELLAAEVPLVTDYLHKRPAVDSGHAVMLENVRFNRGEKADDKTLARRYAELCDIFVMDAFGAAHRAQASTHGVVVAAPEAVAGPLMVNELDALGRALRHPGRPLVAILGGAKSSDKLEVLHALVRHCDVLIVGGAMANTFLAATGHRVGKSLCEPDFVDEARKILSIAHAREMLFPLPLDVVVAESLSESAEADVKSVAAVGGRDMILDIGPDTAEVYRKALRDAETIVWNGPVGVFEYPQFAEGTRSVAEAVADSGAFSLIGGGDTIAALDRFGLRSRVSYISTGGGAFLNFVEGRKLPAVAALESRAARG